jgi:hypothetical protein
MSFANVVFSLRGLEESQLCMPVVLIKSMSMASRIWRNCQLSGRLDKNRQGGREEGLTKNQRHLRKALRKALIVVAVSNGSMYRNGGKVTL